MSYRMEIYYRYAWNMHYVMFVVVHKKGTLLHMFYAEVCVGEGEREREREGEREADRQTDGQTEAEAEAEAEAETETETNTETEAEAEAVVETERHDQYNIKYRGFESSWYLLVRRPSASVNRGPGVKQPW